jgi:hypothetical protein
MKGQIVAVYVKADGGVVTQVVNAGEKFNPATQKVEPMTAEESAEAEAMATSIKGGARTEEAVIETPPVIFVSPVVGGSQ